MFSSAASCVQFVCHSRTSAWIRSKLLKRKGGQCRFAREVSSRARSRATRTSAGAAARGGVSDEGPAVGPREMRYRLLEGRLVPILKRGDECDLALAESRARRQLEQIAVARRRDRA